MSLRWPGTCNSSKEQSDYKTTSEDESTVLKTQKGELNVKQHGIKKRTKSKNVKLSCTVCKEKLDNVKDLNNHMHSVHSDYRYSCKVCGKQYENYNAKYKHEQTHFKERFVCQYCDKGFIYLYMLKEHVKTHTGKGLIPCTWPKCTKTFVSTKNMYQHLLSHKGEEHTCVDCNKIFNNKYLYKQHRIGKHGDGYFTAKCGEQFKWPEQRREHQKDCKLVKI